MKTYLVAFALGSVLSCGSPTPVTKAQDELSACDRCILTYADCGSSPCDDICGGGGGGGGPVPYLYCSCCGQPEGDESGCLINGCRFGTFDQCWTLRDPPNPPTCIRGVLPGCSM